MEKSKKKEFSILGISIWKLGTYFIIYSFLGYIIETIFGIVTMGIWECRQSFLYGPFLGIYGVGAVAIILFSQFFDKNNFTLFLGGYAIGTAVEYAVSFLTEAILETKWWDYSGKILNINGRVCLLYSSFWGILTVFLVRKVNPKIDQFMRFLKKKISIKVLKSGVAFLIIFLAIDCLATCYAQDQFITRMVVEKGIPVSNYEEVQRKYEKTYQNEALANFIHTFWGDEKMIRTFPNIKIEDKDHNTIYLSSLLPEIQPYYKKIFEK